MLSKIKKQNEEKKQNQKKRWNNIFKKEQKYESKNKIIIVFLDQVCTL